MGKEVFPIQYGSHCLLLLNLATIGVLGFLVFAFYEPVWTKEFQTKMQASQKTWVSHMKPVYLLFYNRNRNFRLTRRY